MAPHNEKQHEKQKIICDKKKIIENEDATKIFRLGTHIPFCTNEKGARRSLLIRKNQNKKTHGKTNKTG